MSDGKKITLDELVELVEVFVDEIKDVTEIRIFESPEHPDLISGLKRAKLSYNPCRSGLVFSNSIVENRGSYAEMFLNLNPDSNIVTYESEEVDVIKADSVNGNQFWFNLPKKP